MTTTSPNPTMLSDVDHADFLSAVSQSRTVSRTISETDFMSAVGEDDDDEFDVLPRSGGSSPVGDEFDEVGSWTSVSQPRR